MVKYQHRADRALVQLSGELTHAEAVELVDTVELLVRAYFYALVELHIASPGGASTALEHYLDAQRRWRAAGIRLRTRVVERAASAAALMLSLGDERIAEPGASLLYHRFRMTAETPVTASGAALMFADLTELDERCLARLIDRAMDGDAARVPADVAAADLRMLELLTAHLPSGAKGGRPRTARGLARLLERTVRGAIRAGDRETIAAIYRTLCRSDEPISPAVARALRLIDHVGEPESAPAPAQGTPGLTVPEWRSLYPPHGDVARELLLRHALALGDTGSGKTCSAVLPVVRALVNAPAGRVGCALIIDPKGEIGAMLEREAPGRLRTLAPSESGLDLMAGSGLRLDADLASGRYLSAAGRIVRRVLSFEPSLPTRVLADHRAQPASTSAELFDREGTSLLTVVLAFVLMITDRHALPPEQWCAHAKAARWVRGLLDRALGRPDERGHNALALAAHVLDTVVAPGGPRFDPDSDRDVDAPPWRFATVVRAASALWRDCPGEAPDIIDRVLSYWHPMARLPVHFGHVVAAARAACGALAEPGLARSVYFGCEPGAAGAGAIARDFARAVSREAPGQMLLYQPALDKRDALMGKVLKATFFESVFDDPDRRSGGAHLPLAAYVADEFHRFATGDAVHGEPSFLDACRSFGVLCVLACQSVASLEHALAERGGGGARDRAAVSVVWHNTGSKLFFRCTDPRTAERIDDACPIHPGLAPVTRVRPVASLAPGECYAVLADGRFERRQLDPVLSAAAERGASRRHRSRA